MWESIENCVNCRGGNNFTFKIMSYNVLAQYLLEGRPNLHNNILEENLRWNVRRERIYNEILRVDPDIICFQEVQASHLEEFYSRFENIGYRGLFKKKTGQRQDGCAIYIRRSKFFIEQYITVEFLQPVLPVLRHDNVGLAVRLRALPDISPEAAAASPFIVATTHLLSTPERDDVRLAQMQLFLAELDRFAYCTDGRCTGYYPMILTGDLNSPPDSAAYKLVDWGVICAERWRANSDWRHLGITDQCQHLAVYLDRPQGRVTDDSMIKTHNSDAVWPYWLPPERREAQMSQLNDAITMYEALFKRTFLSHAFLLSSVYRPRPRQGVNEANMLRMFHRVTVDYIYFTHGDSLNLLRRLRLPTEAEYQQMGPLPNMVYGSDHLALGAVFELLPPNANL